MAIKVVQGFIDTGGGPSSSSPTNTRAPASSSPGRSPSLLIRQSLQLEVQQASRVTTSAANQLLQSEATISSIRKGSVASKSERTPVNDPDKAQQLADSVTEDIRDEGEGAFDAHAGLKGPDAREHFVS